MRTSLYNYLLFVIFGATVTINHCCMAESASAVHKNIYVRLAGAGEVNRFVMTDCHASPISTGRSKQKNQVDQQMAALVTDLELKKDIRKKAVTQISANLGSKMFSADFSPNGKYAIVAFDDPMISAVKRAAIIQIPDGQIVMNIRDDSQIEDMLWCTNSDVLLILASQQHVQLSIRGIMMALAGHPLQKKNFSIVKYNLGTLSAEKIVLEDSVLINANGELGFEESSIRRDR